MAEALIERESRILELFKRAFAVPKHNPVLHDDQPHPIGGFSQALKLPSIPSLRPIFLNGDAPTIDLPTITVQHDVVTDSPQQSSVTIQNNVGSMRSQMPRQNQESPPPSQSLLSTASPRAAGKTKIFSKRLSWSRWRQSPRRPAAVKNSIPLAAQQEPSQRVGEALAESISTHLPLSSPESGNTAANPGEKSIQEDAQANVQVNESSSRPRLDGSPPTHTHESSNNIVANLDIVAATTSVLEPVGSPRLFHTSDGMLVGQLNEIPPPHELESQWRKDIRPKLFTNLQQVMLSLPTNLTQAETAIALEFCMSGKAQSKAQNVSLEATIWIRCGSHACEQSVRSAVSKMRVTQGRLVHVTQCAPRPANQTPQALEFYDGKWLLPVEQSDVDDIVPIDNPVSGSVRLNNDWKQLIGNGSIHIRVEAPLNNHNSTCGLSVHFLTSNGSTYKCTVGGTILVDDKIFALTTAHALWDPGFSSQTSSTTNTNVKHSIYGPYYDFYQGRSGYETTFPAGQPAQSPPNFLRAALVAAQYGTGLDLDAQDESSNQDFALLHVDFEEGQDIKNEYRTSSAQYIVDTTSNDLTSRDVHLLSLSGIVSWGKLLDGTSIIMDRSGVWETRKIRLKTRLGSGASGTWVVDGRALLGIVTAVYDDEAFAHMIPIQSVFSGIKSVLTKNNRQPQMKVNGRSLKAPYIALPLPTTFPTPNQRKMSKPTQAGLESIISMPKPLQIDTAFDDSVYAISRPKPKDESYNRITTVDVFIPACFMVLALTWDISTFPIVMPSITDNSDSLGYIGWYGSAYLLSFGTMSTEAHIIYALVVNQWPAQGLTYVLAASIIVFGAGLISSCVSNSIASIVVGRALCGLGASAMLTGLFLIHESLRKLQRYKSAALLLMVHAIISLIAPISAAAFSNNNTNHRGYKDNFFFGIALTGVTLVMVCKYISGRSLKCCKAVITKTDTLQVTALAVVLTVLRMVLLAGGFVGLIMGFYLAFARSSKTVSSGRIFGSFAITALCYGALAYLRKYKRPQLRKSTVSLKADSTGFFVRSFIKYVWGSAFYSFTHFYPVWLRTVQNQSTLQMGARYQPLAAAYLLAFFAKAVSSTIRPGAKFRGVKIQSAFPVFSLAMMSLAAGLSSIYHSQSSSSVYVVFAVFFSGGAAWNFVDYGQPLEFWMHRIEQVTEDDHAMFFSNVSRAIQLIATEALGGCLGISVAQLVFAAQLSGASVGPYHNVYKSLVLSGRASSWTSRVEPDFVDDVKFFFDRTLTNTFYVAAAAGAGTFVVFLVAVVLSSFVPGRKLLEKWQKEQDIHRNLTNNSISATDNSFGEANLGDSAMRERNLNILTVRDRPRWALRTPFRYFLSPQQREIAEIEMQAVSRRRRRSSRTTESLNSEDDVRSEARAI